MTFYYNNVYLEDTSTIAGPYEKKGPLRKYFDKPNFNAVALPISPNPKPSIIKAFVLAFLSVLYKDIFFQSI